MDNHGDLRAKIMAINNDPNLTDAEKAVKRQELMSGKWSAPAEKKGAHGWHMHSSRRPRLTQGTLCSQLRQPPPSRRAMEFWMMRP
jgi:hypothetical protein